MRSQSQQNLGDQYKRLLQDRDSLGGLESIDRSGSETLLSESSIDSRSDETRSDLHRIVEEFLGNEPYLHSIADQVVDEGRAALSSLAQNGFAIEDQQLTSSLEVIVRADGSRPSFMVREGDVDLATSPAGAWAAQLQASAASGLLPAALACVGRIDLPGSAQGFEGTGFLIHENLLVTNRHVLQAIARPDATGKWTFKPGVTINFGHEFRVADKLSPRSLKRVAYCPAKVISSPIDHSKLDLVLIEVESAVESEKPKAVLAIDVSPDWAVPGQYVYTVGYPGNPGLGEPLSLLEQLFQSTFGCKRLAPGQCQIPASTVQDWTLVHDATTLGGNSGSVLLVPGRENVAAALHYGGTRATPRENWGHVLGRVLDELDSATGKTLHQLFGDLGVTLVDRRGS